ncbi:hypothetical protein N8267_01475, partial [Pelagibacteraceae bacterium]|nr:hypothetical protein [Pelagibacteraceae bacterium]
AKQRKAKEKDLDSSEESYLDKGKNLLGVTTDKVFDWWDDGEEKFIEAMMSVGVTGKGVSRKKAECVLKEMEKNTPKNLWNEYMEIVKKDEILNAEKIMSNDKLMIMSVFWVSAYSKCGIDMV